MTSPSTNVTRSLGTSDGEDPAHAIPAADEHLDVISEAIVKPDSVIETIPNVLTTPDFNTEGMINGAVWLVLEGVSCDVDASDGYSTPPSESSTAADSTLLSPTLMNEKDRDVGEGTGGDEDCDNDENYGSDEKSDCDHQRHHHPTLYKPPLYRQRERVRTSNYKDIEPRIRAAPASAFLLSRSHQRQELLLDSSDHPRIEPYGVPEVPAYARSSMSSWFHSPANSSIQGTVQGLPLPTRRRRTHQVEPRPFARNKNEITPHNKPEVPKEGPTPWVKRLPMYKAVVMSGFDKK
ncbi:hypothetical protein HBI55_159130 [Parastagonospora nodorum]|nr:hypothetical protein HBI10_236790 [Parastagonospora nodorum]KAH4022062.1 hypothetical protein HBI13_097440 [Parastagonospora nodorum]KAH4081980.1 hypothetical protein HBH46_223380 [Parastagonospora nodorum]KAH4178353.1 hypothetical protein HBH43_022980 [Parastagonospora nodorum]KAH4194440.1 hypothetical protein HBH42_097640 [Parastagonospora nodorum]